MGIYDTFYKANVVATKNLLEVIHNKQQLIYISTANIYFNFQNRKSICEDDPLPNTLIIIMRQQSMKSSKLY